MVQELNWLYRREPALYEVDDDYRGFEWIDFHDAESSVISFVRFARNREDFMVFACNFTPVPRERLPHRRAEGRPLPRNLQHRLGDVRRLQHGQRRSRDRPKISRHHGRPASLNVTLPPLAVVAFKL